MKGHIEKWGNKGAHGEDTNFLEKVIWPKIKDEDKYVHDAYCCEDFNGTVPFSTKRYHNFQFVGQVFDGENRILKEFMYHMMNQHATAPCRKHPEWVWG